MRRVSNLGPRLKRVISHARPLVVLNRAPELLSARGEGDTMFTIGVLWAGSTTGNRLRRTWRWLRSTG
jgi:hypothetical protein